MIIYNRIWAMPSKWTFTIMPIKHLIHRYINDDGRLWIDPFSGTSRIAKISNDINPIHSANTTGTAIDFIKSLNGEYDGVLFDPPYSPRQIKEVYESADIKNSFENTQASFWSIPKDLIAPKIKRNGIAISFGWNSGGFGKNRGFELIEILLVPHGGAHNDTIVTVERKLFDNLF